MADGGKFCEEGPGSCELDALRFCDDAFVLVGCVEELLSLVLRDGGESRSARRAKSSTKSRYASRRSSKPLPGGRSLCLKNSSVLLLARKARTVSPLLSAYSVPS